VLRHVRGALVREHLCPFAPLQALAHQLGDRLGALCRRDP
jgi:hypothetical protein